MRARLRAARDDGGDEDGGFTLIEVVIAIVLFAMVAQGLAAALIGSATSTTVVKMSQTAKNLAQQRIDAMRSLPYHVDAQNGPYVDLLDLYFHSASGTVDTLPDIVQTPSGGVVTVPGQYQATGSVGGVTGPSYQVTIAGNLLGQAYAKFTEVVYTQFLRTDNPTAAPLAASQIPSTYNNTLVGKDQPPSPIVGVTVVVTWSVHSQAHVLRTFTEITNEGTDSSLVVAQAKATAVQIQSQDYAGNAITGIVASVTLNGSLSSGSQAGASATGASISDGAVGTVLGAQGAAVAPPNPSGTAGLGAATGRQQIGTSGSCGWGAFGPTQNSDVTATAANGQPRVPADAAASASPAVSASLLASGGNACAGMWLSNAVDGSPSTDPSLNLWSGPMVSVQDQTGSSPILTGSGDVFTGPAGPPGAVAATAATTSSTWVKVFPGLSFVPAPPSGYGISWPYGLVDVQLTSSTLDCTSTIGGGTNATLGYSGNVAWYTYTAGWQIRSFSWASGSGAGDPLSVVDVTKAVNSAGTPLSAYVPSVSGATSVVGGSGGVQSVEAAVSISTVPTLGSSYPGSTLGVELGHLSCVAQDNRS